MQDFKTRFNYLTFSLIFIGFVVFVILGFVVIIYGSTILDILSAKEKNKIAMYIGLSMVPLGIAWMVFFLGQILKNYRFILTFTKDKIFITDAIFRTIYELPISEITYYKEATYLGDILLKATTISLKDGRQLRALNILTINFDKLNSELKRREIKKLSFYR